MYVVRGSVTAVVIIVCTIIGAAPLAAQQTLLSPNPDFSDNFGGAVALSDVNADGFADVVVGAPHEGTGFLLNGAGRAYVFDGADGEVLAELTSPNGEMSGNFGDAVAAAGDVNDDGIQDLLVGAPSENAEGTDRAGRAYLISGDDFSVLQTLTSDVTPRAQFGMSVAGVGDVDGDGADDVIVGAANETMGDDEQAGRAYVVGGADGSILHTLASPDPVDDGRFGISLAGIGDVDGDGVPDVVVGAPGDNVEVTNGTGLTYIFSGADGSLVHTLSSGNPEPGGDFGAAVAAAGDVSGDGVPDVLVGADHETTSVSSEGRAYLLSGADGSVLTTLTSPNATSGGNFGSAVAGAGVVDDDGIPDVVISALTEDTGETSQSGRAYVMSGADGTVLESLVSPNPETLGTFGWALAGNEDVDGDGLPDLVVGAAEEDGGAGRTYVFRSTEDELPTDVTRPTAQTFSVHGHAPNPFTEQATIRYTLSGPADVSLSVYDVLGRRVDVLIDNRQNGGHHDVIFRAGELSPGIYLYRLQAGDDVVTGRMVLVE